MTNSCLRRSFGVSIAAAVIGSIAFLVLPTATYADSADMDFQFASGLIELGFPDFAEKVVEQVVRLNPTMKDRAKLIQAEILISKRKFADAEALVKEMGASNPKAQAISLALAKGYYLTGDTEKAKQLYNDFFKQYEGKVPTDPDLLRFYQDSAYQFGQMLEAASDLEGAVKAYTRVLATNPDRNVTRRLQAQQAELLVRIAASGPIDQKEKNLAEAKKLCETLQWGGMDIWFGQSLITMAHIEMEKGNDAGARKVLQSNMDILKQVDEFMKAEEMPLSLSPMAGARFLLGQLFEKQAKELSKQKDKGAETVQAYASALTEFYNVFAQYGASDWGPGAGVKAQEIKTLLERNYGKKVNVELGDYSSKAAESQFRLADNLFRQKQYKGAGDEYLKVLNQFPRTDASPAALGNLALSYANLKDPLMVKMVAGYLGESFAGNDRAALALLGLGKFYFDAKDEPMYMYVYNQYLDGFPKHAKAASILFTLALLKKQAGDAATANTFFQRIVDSYPTDQYYTKALNQLAWGTYQASNYTAAIPAFTRYINEARPSPDKAQAQFCLADAYRQTGKWAEALAAFETVIQWLAPKDNPYGSSADEIKRNAGVLEKAAFQKGFSLSRMTEPPEQVKEYRDKGIKAYDVFLTLFPQSELAPKALNGKGTLQLEIGQFDAAVKTFDELAQKYPNSDEGKSAIFSLVRSAMEVKQLDQARAAFAKMIANKGIYSADQFARIGQLMIEAKMYPEAQQAFEQVTTSSQERNLLERSYFGLGQALFEQKNYDQAIRALEDLMQKYPKSGLFYDAKFTLGAAYRQVGALSNAVLALSDVFKYADKPVLINKASYDLGTIQIEQGEKQAALASFMRVALLADPKNPDLRPLVEQSLMQTIIVGMELQRYQDVQDSCDQYLSTFPESDKIEQVRKYKADAKLLAAQAAPAAPAAPAAQPAQPGGN